jgi:hypothetical protein
MITACMAVLALVFGVGLGSGPAVAALPAAIQGQVLSWMDPIGYAKVTVFNASTGDVLRSAHTDGDGYYRIGGLPAVRVKVRASKRGYLDSWASGAASRAAADVYTLVAGRTLRQSWGTPKVLYLDLTPESVITGSVMGFNEGPENPWDDPLSGVRIKVFSAATGAFLGHALTNSHGEFRIGQLPAGPVKVRASKLGWLTTWAHDKETRAAADVYTVRPFEPISVDVLSMYAPASIEGQVLSAMDPVVGDVRVAVLNADTGAVIRSVMSDSDGNYRVDLLPPGRIKVRASKPGYITNWANSFGRVTWETATVFTLGPGQVLTQTWSPVANLYLDIQREAVIQGQVLGNFDPLGYATVTVFDATTGTALRSTRADGDGYYRVGGIDAMGGLSVKVRASKAGWVSSWANGKPSMATADTFSLYPGAHLQQSWDPTVLYLDLTRIQPTS